MSMLHVVKVVLKLTMAGKCTDASTNWCKFRKVNAILMTHDNYKTRELLATKACKIVPGKLPQLGAKKDMAEMTPTGKMP